MLFTFPVKVRPHSVGNSEHKFEMTFEPDIDLFAMRSELQEAAEEALAETTRNKDKVSTAKGRGPHCTINFGTSEIGKYRLQITLNGVLADPQNAENAVVCAIGSLLHSKRSISDGA
ncbi:hypothetical protein [Qipengyuania atrilutea]|uniref:Uncharacterized protein n=1 Tax=Qipengyuania atrilutea TaxID=2744473 RepID=A0A850H344_9SPHN|nr:hypothetical protein [Actirhodobacter atriluteus]NVD45010.1 hypothetical protein [Actirhodobacter atriluteus]